MPATNNQTDTGARAAVLFLIAGPAGSGKSTLCDRMASDTGSFERVITATTRPPRAGEIDGVHYHFLSEEKFDAHIAAGAFLEWARVHKKHRYGTLASAVLGPLSEGRNLVINVDVQGAESFRHAAATNDLLRRCMVTVYIDVPIPVLRKRLAGRGTDSADEIERRMRTAMAEMLEKPKFDHIIESGTRDADFEALLGIWKMAKSK